METNEKQKIIEKAEYFRVNEIKCHVNTVPKGTFKNGMFLSKLMEDKYFMFMCENGIPFKLFLIEIYDIEEYRERKNDLGN